VKFFGTVARKATLIPRYNWDFGARELVAGLLGVLRHNGSGLDVLKQVFGEDLMVTGSGRASLFALLRALRLPVGAEVGVPLFCCTVVFDAIKRAGFKPRFIDIDMDDFNLSTVDLERKARSLSAVVVVHMFGHPADLRAISRICNVPILEDCAQSLFSRFQNQETGRGATASFFSFRSGKYLSVGEASIILCSEPRLRAAITEALLEFEAPGAFEQVRHCLATYLKSVLYHMPWYGLVSYPLGRLLDKRLNLTAKAGFERTSVRKSDLAVLERKLNGFREKVDQQRNNAQYLLNNLRLRHAKLPIERPDCWSNYYQFALRFESFEQRAFVARHLRSCGVDAAEYLDDVVEVARSHYGYAGDCPNAERCSKTTLVIPNYYTLSQGSLNRVVHSLNESDRLFEPESVRMNNAQHCEEESRKPARRTPPALAVAHDSPDNAQRQVQAKLL
jgi:dTDP-4-amino-4,6-dideoxygalactose transaminase